HAPCRAESGRDSVWGPSSNSAALQRRDTTEMAAGATAAPDKPALRGQALPSYTPVLQIPPYRCARDRERFCPEELQAGNSGASTRPAILNTSRRTRQI